MAAVSPAHLPQLKPSVLNLIHEGNLQGLYDVLKDAQPNYGWRRGEFLTHPQYSRTVQIAVIANTLFEKYNAVKPKEFSFETRALGDKVHQRLLKLSKEASKLYKTPSAWEDKNAKDKYLSSGIKHPFRVFDSERNFKEIFPNQTYDKVINVFQWGQIALAYDAGLRNVTASNKSTPQRDAAIKADADALKADFLRANATGKIYQQSRSNYTAPTSPYALVATPNGIESRMDAIGQGWLVPARSDYR